MCQHVNRLKCILKLINFTAALELSTGNKMRTQNCIHYEFITNCFKNIAAANCKRLKLESCLTNKADSDKTAAVSELDLDPYCLLRHISPNIQGTYGVQF